MRKHAIDVKVRGSAIALGGGCSVAILCLGLWGCSDNGAAEATGSPGGMTAGSDGAGGARGGRNGSTGEPTAGAPGSAGQAGGTAGASGQGGSAAGAGGSGGGSGGAGGSPVDGAPIDPDPGSGGSPGPDAGGAGGGAPSAPPGPCGAIGQACCAENTCMGNALPTPDPETGGVTVLHLKASGSDPYALFRAKDLLPIDGPDSDYITDTGDSFLFVLHQNGAEETVSSGAQRQRNEVTVNPGNPRRYKGQRDETITYTWRFRLERMNANPTWCDIFQIKQQGPLGVAPYLALEARRDQLEVDSQKMGVVSRVPLSQIMNVWINASLTIKYADAGSINLSLKRDDGTVALSYVNNNADFWDTNVNFVRPKWGLYRNKANGAGEAAIRYNDMKIIRGTPPEAAACTCR